MYIIYCKSFLRQVSILKKGVKPGSEKKKVYFYPKIRAQQKYERLPPLGWQLL